MVGSSIRGAALSVVPPSLRRGRPERRGRRSRTGPTMVTGTAPGRSKEAAAGLRSGPSARRSVRRLPTKVRVAAPAPVAKAGGEPRWAAPRRSWTRPATEEVPVTENRSPYPGPGGRVARPAALARAVAGEVAAAAAALRRAGVPVGGVRRAERRGVLRHPVHRPLPAGAVRLQPRGAALDLAGAVLRATARWAPTGTRRSRWPTSRTTRRASTCPTPSGSPAAWCW